MSEIKQTITEKGKIAKKLWKQMLFEESYRTWKEIAQLCKSINWDEAEKQTQDEIAKCEKKIPWLSQTKSGDSTAKPNVPSSVPITSQPQPNLNIAISVPSVAMKPTNPISPHQSLPVHEPSIPIIPVPSSRIKTAQEDSDSYSISDIPVGTSTIKVETSEAPSIEQSSIITEPEHMTPNSPSLPSASTPATISSPFSKLKPATEATSSVPPASTFSPVLISKPTFSTMPTPRSSFIPSSIQSTDVNTAESSSPKSVFTSTLEPYSPKPVFTSTLEHASPKPVFTEPSPDPTKPRMDVPLPGISSMPSADSSSAETITCPKCGKVYEKAKIGRYCKCGNLLKKPVFPK